MTTIDPRVHDLLPADLVASIEDLRAEGQRLQGMGCCEFVSWGIADLTDSQATQLFYADEDGSPITMHWINYLRGGRILDATADQFEDGGYAVRIVGPGDATWDRYRPEFTSTYNPSTHEELRHLPWVGSPDRDVFAARYAAPTLAGPST